AQLDKAAGELLALCNNRFFFAFYGDLGAGKTTFIKAICNALGSKDSIVSPTFSLVNEYLIQSPDAPPRHICHMDFYRLSTLDEALDIGVDEYFKKENVYCFIEWPELVESLLPENTVRVKIQADEDNSRTLRIEL